VTLPYTVELNDIPMMIVQHHESDYLPAAPSISSTGSTPRAKARKNPRARHPSLHQRPAAPDQISRSDLRACPRFDGVVYWTGEEILDWYLKSGAGRAQVIVDRHRSRSMSCDRERRTTSRN
jgi:allantoinase